MTAYATRSPLQLVTNTYYMMSDQPRSTRRTSARLLDKEDATLVNGGGYGTEKSVAAQSYGTSLRAGKAASGGAGRPKRKQEFNDDDDLSWIKPKRTRAAQAVKVPEVVVEERREDSRPLPVKKSRKKSAEPSSSLLAENGDAPPRRKSTRHSSDKSVVPTEELSNPKKRPKEPVAAKSKKGKQPAIQQEDDDRMDLVGDRLQTPVHNLEASSDGTKIALPFADTPIIRRNKEMRKGGGDGARRSSLGMRGRRASSLIDSGTSNALPHSEVESSEFYKHIEPGLPEPRRMRQLLTWCGTRALGEKPSFGGDDSHAKLAAREIQQQLLKDFSSRSEMSDWFSREDEPVQRLLLRPNPKNLGNLSKITDLENQLARLRSERESWEKLLKPPADTFSLPPLPQTVPTLNTLDTSLLSVSDTTALSSFEGLQISTTEPLSLQATTKARLTTITSKVEFETDKLADSVHVLSQHLQGSEKVANGVLGACAKVLEIRDREAAERQGDESVGTRDVLRALSRAVES